MPAGAALSFLETNTFQYISPREVCYELVVSLPSHIIHFRLATKGRLVTIGFITGYKSKLGFTPSKNATLVPKVPRDRTVFSLRQ